jgi:hypothetical protein
MATGIGTETIVVTGILMLTIIMTVMDNWGMSGGENKRASL